MKRIISFMLSLLLAFSLIACSFHSEVNDVTDPETSIEMTETEEPSTNSTESEISDLSANAEAMLEEMTETHLCDETFVNVIMANVPDVFMLTDIEFACWTYFLIMNDGLEYIVTTDENGRITTIAYWNSETGTDGPIIYTLNE